MVDTTHILLLVVLLMPLACAAIVPIFGRAARRAALWLAILHLLATAALVAFSIEALSVQWEFQGGYQTNTVYRFIPHFVPGYTSERAGLANQTTWTIWSLTSLPATKAGPYIQYFVGLDGFNVWLIALASFILIPAILVSWDSVRERSGAFYGWMFFLQGAAMGAFASFDVILFYVYFELTLIPAFFLIGGWGNGSGKRDAARKFFLYTLAGSLLTLVGLIGVVFANPNADGSITFSLPELMANVQLKLAAAEAQAKAGHPEILRDLLSMQAWLFFALMGGFLVKVPIWPFHTWLPSAYGESPIGVTVLLASLLAKLGTFGILRYVLPLTPDAALAYGLPAIGSLAAFGIIYAALCAYNQKDLKLTIAYSSVSHLGLLVLGLFAFNREGLSGASLHMLNHGLSTGALFALLAFLIDRYKNLQLSQYGGLMGRYPKFAVLAFVLCLASIGLPGLNNFVSEMLMLSGLFDARNPGISGVAMATIGAVGILLGAWYMLTMMQKVFFNPVKVPEPVEAAPTDLKSREFAAYGSIAFLCLLLGLVPQVVLDSMRFEVKQLAMIGDGARARAGAPIAVYEAPPPAIIVDPSMMPRGAGAGGNKGGGNKGGGGKGGGNKGGGNKGGGGKGGGPKGGNDKLNDD